MLYIFGIAPSIHVTRNLNPVSKKCMQTPTLQRDLLRRTQRTNLQTKGGKLKIFGVAIIE